MISLTRVAEKEEIDGLLVMLGTILEDVILERQVAPSLSMTCPSLHSMTILISS